MGRPKSEIDPQQVKKLAELHCSVSEIGDILGCGRDTIYRRFRDELDEGRARGKMRLRTMQLKAAQNGSAAMCIWLGKQILNQKDQHEIVAVDDEEKRLTDEEVDEMLEKIRGDDITARDKTEKSGSTSVSK